MNKKGFEVMRELCVYVAGSAWTQSSSIHPNESTRPTPQDAVLEKPVVVIPGVSHQQFADGTQARIAKATGR